MRCLAIFPLIRFHISVILLNIVTEIQFFFLFQRNLSAPNQVQLPTGDESCGTDQSDDASNSLYRNRDPTSDVDIVSVDHLLAQEGLLFTANKVGRFHKKLPTDSM